MGVTVEYEHDVNVPILGVTIGKFKASAAFKNTNTWEWDSSYEVEKSVQYSCVGGEDEVIFTSVPVDSYQYQIDCSTDPKNAVGKSLYITIPRAYNTYMVTRDFFNQSIGVDVISPIDATVLGHTIGAPRSYPSASQKAALLAEAFSEHPALASDYQLGPNPVAQGSDNAPSAGTTNLQIAVTASSAETVSHDFSLDTEVGAGVGDWTVLLTAGFEVGYSATSSTSAGTTFGGTVGYLPTAYYSNPNYAYQAGLFAYPYRPPTGKSFWVVDYWIQ